MCPTSYSNLTSSSFAFVEYEDRRDADDAYHEMHNKRIGRDDMLKIEVGRNPGCKICLLLTQLLTVGPHPSFCLLALRVWS